MSPLKDGYAVMNGLLTTDDIGALRAAITETIDHVAQALRAPCEASHPEAPLEDRLQRVAEEDRAYSFALLHAVMADAHRDPRLHELTRHPKLEAVVREAIAPRVPIGHVVRPRAVVPAFRSERSRWHQDVSRKTRDDAGCGAVRVACWIPLSDVDADTGALELMPGCWEEPLPHQTGDDGRFHIADEDLPDGPRRVVPVRRGDVLLLDAFLPHRALPVHHQRARWSVVVWVKAAGGETRPC